VGNKERHPRKQSDYHSYLLRMWRAQSEEEVWQASLESAHAPGRQGFADLESLFSFLRRQTSRRRDACQDIEERRWSTGTAHQRSQRRKVHWLKICKIGKERKR
jgi:hypothetical protein